MHIALTILEYPWLSFLFCAIVYAFYSSIREAKSESFFSYLYTLAKYGAIVGVGLLVYGVLISLTPYGANQLGPIPGIILYGPSGLLLGFMLGAIIWLLGAIK